MGTNRLNIVASFLYKFSLEKQFSSDWTKKLTANLSGAKIKEDCSRLKSTPISKMS